MRGVVRVVQCRASTVIRSAWRLCDSDNCRQMETIGAFVYFASILGGLPLFIALDALALIRFRGWARLLPVAAAAYMAWILLVEFAPVFLHWREMDPSDFRRLTYERWSAVARPAIHAGLFVLALLLLRSFSRWRRDVSRALRRASSRTGAE